MATKGDLELTTVKVVSKEDNADRLMKSWPYSAQKLRGQTASSIKRY